MERSVLEMIGGEKHINPHYDIKAESSSCYPISKCSAEIDINEMMHCIDKQRKLLIKAKEIIKDYMLISSNVTVCSVSEEKRCINVLKLNKQAEEFLNSEVEE